MIFALDWMPGKNETVSDVNFFSLNNVPGFRAEFLEWLQSFGVRHDDDETTHMRRREENDELT